MNIKLSQKNKKRNANNILLMFTTRKLNDDWIRSEVKVFSSQFKIVFVFFNMNDNGISGINFI